MPTATYCDHFGRHVRKFDARRAMPTATYCDHSGRHVRKFDARKTSYRDPTRLFWALHAQIWCKLSDANETYRDLFGLTRGR